MASLSIQNVSKSFGQRRVLENVSFEVGEGEFCVLLGPSGCGKTTLLRLVAGLDTGSSGIIFIGENQVDRLPPGKRDVAFVFQSYALYPHMTVFENLAFSLRLRGLPQLEINSRVTEAAALLAIEDHLHQKPQQLSGGQRQRVAVGRAIVRKPKIFLFDEPLSNLDATLRSNMRVELAKLHRKLDSTVLYVTHDQTEALTLGKKIVVLNGGKIQQIDSPAGVYHRPVNTFVASFVGTPQMNLIEGEIDHDGATFIAGQFRTDLAGLSLQQNLSGQPIILGIRPEDLNPGNPQESSISGEIDFIEDVGADRFVHVSCAGIELIARADTRVPLRQGERLHLKFDPRRLHVFHHGNRVS